MRHEFIQHDIIHRWNFKRRGGRRLIVSRFFLRLELQQEGGDVRSGVGVNTIDFFHIERLGWHPRARVIAARFTHPSVEPVKTEVARLELFVNIGKLGTKGHVETFNGIVRVAVDAAFGGEEFLAALGTRNGIRQQSFKRLVGELFVLVVGSGELLKLSRFGEQIVRDRRDFHRVELLAVSIRLVVELEELRHARRRTEPLRLFCPRSHEARIGLQGEVPQ